MSEDAEPSASTVTLGDVHFDPVAIQDFRLSVKGTSAIGKLNTLAVILEDLADVPVLTLIVEHLGALTPARLVDDRITVVIARPEEGIDHRGEAHYYCELGADEEDTARIILVDYHLVIQDDKKVPGHLDVGDWIQYVRENRGWVRLDHAARRKHEGGEQR